MAKILRVFRDFSHGLSEVANDNMPDNSLVLAKNTIPGDYAGISRATGTVKAYPQINDTFPVIAVFDFQPLTGSALVIAFTQVSATTMNMYKYVNSAWTSVFAGGALLLDYFIYAGKLYWLNGIKIQQYDGYTVSDLAENGSSGLWPKVSAAVTVEQRGQRWFYGIKGNEVIFSDVGFVNKFTATSVINVGASSGAVDEITALHEFNDGILIFQHRAVYMLTGWDFSNGSDIQLSRLNVTTGTNWPKTVKTVENAVLYLGVDGLYQLAIPYYATQIASKNLSEKKIAKRIKSLTLTDSYGEVYGGVYHLGLLSADGVKEYRYYLTDKSFWGEFTQAPRCYYRGANALYIGCANGFVLKYDDNSYQYINPASGEPQAIIFTAETKGFDVAGAMFMDAKLKRVLIGVKQYVAQRSNLKMQIKADYADAAWNWPVTNANFDESLVWTEGNYYEDVWGWMDTVTKETVINYKAKRLQFLLYDDHIGQPVTIYGVGTLYKKKKVKGSRDGVTVATPDYN